MPTQKCFRGVHCAVADRSIACSVGTHQRKNPDPRVGQRGQDNSHAVVANWKCNVQPTDRPALYAQAAVCALGGIWLSQRLLGAQTRKS